MPIFRIGHEIHRITEFHRTISFRDLSSISISANSVSRDYILLFLNFFRQKSNSAIAT